LRIHVALAVLSLSVGAVVRLPPLGWAVLALACSTVIGAELFNTALEALVDLVSPQDHPLARRAKDAAAAAVLVVSGGAVAVGGALAVYVLVRP